MKNDKIIFNYELDYLIEHINTFRKLYKGLLKDNPEYEVMLDSIEAEIISNQLYLDEDFIREYSLIEECDISKLHSHINRKLFE